MVLFFADPAVIRPTWLDRAFLPQIFEQRRQVFLNGNGHFLGVFKSCGDSVLVMMDFILIAYSAVKVRMAEVGRRNVPLGNAEREIQRYDSLR